MAVLVGEAEMAISSARDIAQVYSIPARAGGTSGADC